MEEQDPAKAQAIWNQAQEILVRDVPALYLYEGNYRLPMRSDIAGFVFNGVDIETFDFYALHRT